ncbi:MAG: Rrf2 family transcriptional regulator [Candidatus Eisenbacteria bacterium]|nr:Rrf2 family transcriptional regulator [Candidatus Eisenbacteria bacterium]
MKLSTAGKYAIRAMFELALRHGSGPVPAKDLTRSQMIPFEYLEHLLARLRKAGLVESIRGVKGGYNLSTSPRKTRIGDILRAVEGPLELGSCACASSSHVKCGRAEDCVSRLIMVKLGSEISRVLDEITLEDLKKEVRGTRTRLKDGYLVSCSL